MGENVIFTITAINNGPGDATGVEVTDLLPNGYDYDGYTIGRVTFNSATGVWNVGNLNVGESGTLSLRGTVLSSGSYINTATRTASTPTDANAANDTASASTVPYSTADIAVTKTVSNATPTVGEDFTFTITVANNGPGNAEGIQVNDPSPNGYSFVRYTGTGPSYNPTSGIITVGAIDNGGNERILSPTYWPPAATPMRLRVRPRVSPIRMPPTTTSP